jgi:hypothetical protein
MGVYGQGMVAECEDEASHENGEIRPFADYGKNQTCCSE